MGRLVSGFTLVELMIVVALVGILAAIGVPSYQGIITSNRTAAEINGLVAHLQYARSVAVKQGQTVTITSNSGNTWSNGWKTTDADGKVLKQQQAFQSGDTLTSTLGAIGYDRNGFATGNAILTLTDQSNNPAWRKCILVSVVGQIALKTEVACP